MTRAIFSLFILLISAACHAAETAKPKRPSFENEHFRIGLTPRTPNQMAAFYTGRGFPQFAIDELRKPCFITVGLRNKSQDILWFDLSNWRFHTTEGELKRYHRQDWRQRWQELGLEKRFQSTFRWTLMPEALDFRPYEGEGGNIILPRTTIPMTITASIAVGESKSKSKSKSKVYAVTIENVLCAQDP